MPQSILEGGVDAAEEARKRILAAHRAGERTSPRSQITQQALATQRAGERTAPSRQITAAERVKIAEQGSMRLTGGRTMPGYIPADPKTGLPARGGLAGGALAAGTLGIAGAAAAPTLAAAGSTSAGALRAIYQKVEQARTAANEALTRGFVQTTTNPVGSARELYGRGVDLVRQGAQGAANVVKALPQTGASAVGQYGPYSPAFAALPDAGPEITSGTGDFIARLTGQPKPVAASTPTSDGRTFDAEGNRLTPFIDAYRAEKAAAQPAGPVSIPTGPVTVAPLSPTTTTTPTRLPGTIGGPPVSRDREVLPPGQGGFGPEPGGPPDIGLPGTIGGPPVDHGQGGFGEVPSGPGSPGTSIPVGEGGQGGQGGQPGTVEQITQQLFADLGSLRDEARNSKAPDVMAIFLSQGKSLIDMLNQQESELRSRAEKEGTQIDPATQFTISELRKRLDEDLRSTQEELNRRGLFHSGILLEIEQKLRTGATSAEGRLLAERLSGIQKTLNENLGRIQGQKFQTASTFGLQGAQGQVDAESENRKRQDDLLGRIVQTQMSLRGQASEESQSAASRALQERLQRERLAQEQGQFDTSQGYRVSNDAAERALRERIARMTAESEAQRVEREIGAGKYKDSPQQPTSAATEVVTNNYIAQLANAPDRQSALAALQAQASEMAAAGADLLKIRQAIEERFPENRGFELPFGIGR